MVAEVFIGELTLQMTPCDVIRSAGNGLKNSNAFLFALNLAV